MVVFRCECEVVLGVDEGSLGRLGECPSCGRILRVPRGAMNAGGKLRFQRQIGASAGGGAAAPVSSEAAVAVAELEAEPALEAEPLIPLAPAASAPISPTAPAARLAEPAEPEPLGEPELPEAEPISEPAPEIAAPEAAEPVVNRTFLIVSKTKRRGSRDGLRPFEWTALTQAVQEAGGYGPYASLAEAEAVVKRLQGSEYGELCEWNIEERETSAPAAHTEAALPETAEGQSEPAPAPAPVAEEPEPAAEALEQEPEAPPAPTAEPEPVAAADEPVAEATDEGEAEAGAESGDKKRLSKRERIRLKKERRAKQAAAAVEAAAPAADEAQAEPAEAPAESAAEDSAEAEGEPVGVGEEEEPAPVKGKGFPPRKGALGASASRRASARKPEGEGEAVEEPPKKGRVVIIVALVVVVALAAAAYLFQDKLMGLLGDKPVPAPAPTVKPPVKTQETNLKKTDDDKTAPAGTAAAEPPKDGATAPGDAAKPADAEKKEGEKKDPPNN